MSGEKALVPELRFPEFEREWEKTDLGSICKISTGKLDANAMVDNGAYPFFTCAKQVYAIDRFAFDAESLLVSGNGANVGYVHYYSGKFNAYQRTYVLTDFDMNIKFIEHYLVRSLKRRIYSEVNEGNTPYIVRSTLSDMRIPKTCSQEQQKIAAFLDAVSKKITLLTDKREALTDYKRGVMHRLFSGTLRFTRSDGSAFPDWDERKLGDVAKIQSGATIDQIGDETGAPVTRIETIAHGDVDFSKVGRVVQTPSLEKYKLRRGDILFSNINSVSHIGKVAFFNDNRTLYHGMNLLRIQSNKSKIEPRFLLAFMRLPQTKAHFQRICNRAVSQASINQAALAKTKVPLPSLEEQTKIADALSALDAKIDAVSAKISQTEAFKKGLLQKMFV
ncbi:restriction endonuclease subunit S [Celeribacter halophilus]|uniref:restriction endonuclease subunit S n=1 Tax=Celeribacter halophilus TaxID=576117 RepID=UPI003A8DBCD2